MCLARFAAKVEASEESVQLKENLPMAIAIAGGTGNFKRADCGLDHDTHNSVHRYARLVRQEKGLSRLVGRKQRNAVSEEWRQLRQPPNVPGLEQVVLVGNQLVLAKGRELKSAS